MTTSKGYVGGLYADITAAPYKALFNSATSSRRIWSLVQLARRVGKAVKSIADQTSPFERGIVVHGNRFILHCVLRRIAKTDDLAKNENMVRRSNLWAICGSGSLARAWYRAISVTRKVRNP